jgi:hypothetical protein
MGSRELHCAFLLGRRDQQRESGVSECGLDGFRNAAVRHLHRRGENRRLNACGSPGFQVIA